VLASTEKNGHTTGSTFGAQPFRLLGGKPKFELVFIGLWSRIAEPTSVVKSNEPKINASVLLSQDEHFNIHLFL
jgi:hypothetical protein